MRDPTLEGDLVRPGVAGEGQRTPSHGAFTRALAPILLRLRHALALHDTPAYPLRKRKAHPRLLVEREQKRRPDRCQLLLPRQPRESLPLPPLPMRLPDVSNNRRAQRARYNQRYRCDPQRASSTRRNRHHPHAIVPAVSEHHIAGRIEHHARRFVHHRRASQTTIAAETPNAVASDRIDVTSSHRLPEEAART